MKALTLWQPYASLIVHGVKEIETRSWPCPPSVLGQRVAIHAAKRKMTDADLDMLDDAGWPVDVPTCVAALGCVIGTVEVFECLPMTECNEHTEHICLPTAATALHHLPLAWEDSNTATETDITDQVRYGHFEIGRYGWLFSDPELFAKPVPARGRQQLWDWGV